TRPSSRSALASTSRRRKIARWHRSAGESTWPWVTDSAAPPGRSPQNALHSPASLLGAIPEPETRPLQPTDVKNTKSRFALYSFGSLSLQVSAWPLRTYSGCFVRRLAKVKECGRGIGGGSHRFIRQKEFAHVLPIGSRWGLDAVLAKTGGLGAGV